MNNTWLSNDEDENKSDWNNTEYKDPTISEWLVDEEQAVEPFIESEGMEVKRNAFYDVYKPNFVSIFEEPKLFHQEHVNKKQIKKDFD